MGQKRVGIFFSKIFKKIPAVITVLCEREGPLSLKTASMSQLVQRCSQLVYVPVNRSLISLCLFYVYVYSFIAYGSSKNWIKHYKSRPIHWQSHHINQIINRITESNKVVI